MSVERASLRSCHTQPAPASRQPPVTAPRNGGRCRSSEARAGRCLPGAGGGHEGGKYTVTVQPYTSPTVAMKAVMNGEGEIAYTADIGMTQFQERVGGFKDFTPTKPELVHSWYAYPMESMMATSAKDADKFKCWK